MPLSLSLSLSGASLVLSPRAASLSLSLYYKGTASGSFGSRFRMDVEAGVLRRMGRDLSVDLGDGYTGHDC